MSATMWYLLGCGTGAGCMLIVILMGLVAVWPDIKTRFRGRG